jgi:hypothetical protein
MTLATGGSQKSPALDHTSQAQSDYRFLSARADQLIQAFSNPPTRAAMARERKSNAGWQAG